METYSRCVWGPCGLGWNLPIRKGSPRFTPIFPPYTITSQIWRLDFSPDTPSQLFLAVRSSARVARNADPTQKSAPFQADPSLTTSAADWIASNAGLTWPIRPADLRIPNMLEIHAQWDDEAQVWIATSDDIPGLCVQADTFDALVDIATGLTPELLEANNVPMTATIPLRITAERTLMAKVA